VKEFEMKLDPIFRLKVMATGCMLGEPEYSVQKIKAKDSPITQEEADHIHSVLEPMSDEDDDMHALECAIDDALLFDHVKTLNLAGDLRNNDNLRVLPQLILVAAANKKELKGTGVIRQSAKRIIKRADEPVICMGYQLSMYGKPIPNSLKRALADAYEGFSEFALAKYRKENQPVTAKQVVNLVHPKCKPGSALHRLKNGILKIGQKTHRDGRETWESVISREGSSHQSWQKAMGLMGHMALLRNLRNLLKNGVNPDLFIDKLVDGAAKGRQLPFRYVAAYRAVDSIGCPPVVKNALEVCLEESMKCVPEIRGRTMALCDNSSSTHTQNLSPMSTMTVADVINLMGVLVGVASDEAHLSVFGDRVEIQPVLKTEPLLKQVQIAGNAMERIGQKSEHGIWTFWDQACKHKARYDNIFIFSDVQPGHGHMYGADGREYDGYVWPTETVRSGNLRIDVLRLIQRYRQEVNSEVNVYMVQVAKYGAVMLDMFHRTFMIGGWSNQLLHFASRMNQLIDDIPAQMAS
jgi:hypothetical protein